jgi:hypothetical protein
MSASRSDQQILYSTDLEKKIVSGLFHNNSYLPAETYTPVTVNLYTVF